MEYERGGLWPEKAFDKYFEEALSQPTIRISISLSFIAKINILFAVLFKDIEVMFPSLETEGGGSNDTLFTTSLISQFLVHLDRISQEDDDIIVVSPFFCY